MDEIAVLRRQIRELREQLRDARASVATEPHDVELQRRLLAAIVDSSHDAILSKDLSGTITSWNAAAERLFGHQRSEAVGQSVLVLIPRDRLHEETEIFGRLRAGEKVEHLETVRVAKDGRRIEVSLTVSPVKDAHGRVCGASTIVRDLTPRREAEAKLRLAEEQLRQAQKMEAVGRLAGGIAHDFNNLLSVILSYSEVLASSLPEPDPMREDAEEIHRAGQRATALVRQLLAFSRQQILQPRVLDVSVLLRGLEKMLRRLLREDIELTFLVDGAVGRIFADAGQVEQVILNLAVNARDALTEGGKITIDAVDVDLVDDYAKVHLGVTPGPYVMIAVADTGTGMDAATRERIFEPFFSTKAKDKGTGLGLATVYGIVKQSGGHIWVYSEPGRGTVFKVYFPRTEAPLAMSTSVPPSTRMHGKETVLLVEDDDQVRGVLRSLLGRAGYNVLEAENGGEGLLIAEQRAVQIDLLLTDVVMPRMSGRQLAERIKSLRPTLRVLFISGYTEHAVLQHGILESGIDFLQKPITPNALLRKVREVLDDTRESPR